MDKSQLAAAIQAVSSYVDHGHGRPKWPILRTPYRRTRTRLEWRLLIDSYPYLTAPSRHTRQDPSLLHRDLKICFEPPLDLRRLLQHPCDQRGVLVDKRLALRAASRELSKQQLLREDCHCIAL